MVTVAPDQIKWRTISKSIANLGFRRRLSQRADAASELGKPKSLRVDEIEHEVGRAAIRSDSELVMEI